MTASRLAYPQRYVSACLTIMAVAGFLTPRAAGWNPSSGDWSKSDPNHVRVMTWNVQDDIRSGTTKTEGFNAWTALARIVAVIKPDVLLLQEAGDNGTFNGVDSVSTLTTVIDQFFHGGSGVTAYVQKYAPGYDLPYIFVSNGTDGYNRNVIVSAFPFADLNGDTRSQYSDIPFILSDLYAPGGNGGIRGFMFAELNLTDLVYEGDLIVGCAHLKSGSGSSDLADRLEAAQNVAYFVDYFYNGGGLGSPDPRSRISDSPQATILPNADTPVILGGDWNEDEQNNGRRGPADWLTQAEFLGGTDGTDRDRTDMTYDSATDVFNGSRNTLGSSKLDYIAVQDNIVTVIRQFVFNSATIPGGNYPAELIGFSAPSVASSVASDHRPVVLDLELPISGGCLNNQDCSNGVFCDGEEICNAGVCGPGTPVDCTDAIPCTADSCNESLDQCDHTPNDFACDDFQFCNGSEVCDPLQGCIAGQPETCDDGVACTVDSCDENLDVCRHDVDDALCSNGQFCDGAETCDLFAGCQPGTPPDCSDDGIACTINDTCNEALDRCEGTPDDQLCGQDETCIAGVGCVNGSLAPPLPANGYPHAALKNRYISFSPSPTLAGISHGYLVTHVDSQVSWFISTPRTTPAAIAGQGLTFLVSDAAPPLADFAALPVIHVGGCLIATDETYEIQATFDGVNLSAPLTVSTAERPTNSRFWADVVGMFSAAGNGSTVPPTPANAWEPPNGAVSGFDISAVLLAVAAGASPPPLTWADVNGEAPDRTVTGGDVLRVVNAFSIGSGREFYPYAHPDPVVPCDICDPVSAAQCGTPPLQSALLP
ncbi:MAG: hypothetical protein J5J06_01680 [Phycisphaerae bacterium]|nr:hypothetical protein [Phycisphaerae bacterium]